MGERLHVGNLSYLTDNQTLRMAFEERGIAVGSVHVMIDQDTGQAQGFGIVELHADVEVPAAIKALDNHRVDGQRITVRET